MTPETSLKRACKQYLRLKGYEVIPIVQGLGSYPGISDWIVVGHGRIVFVELKASDRRGRPGRQSDHQAAFQTRIETNGGQYLLVRSIDDLIEAGL